MQIKTKLALGALFSTLVIVVQAGVGFWGTKAGEKALEAVYENQVEPMGALQDVDGNLKEVRFKMAGVMLDQLPMQGSHNHMKEARKAIPAGWAKFKESTREAVFTEEERKLIEGIEKGMGLLEPFFAKLDTAYASNEKEKIGPLLEEEWPVIHGKLIKPMGQLLPLQQVAVKRAYDESVGRAKKLISIALASGVIGILLALTFAFMISRGVNRSLQRLQKDLEQVAAGDLTVAVDAGAQDEIGRMAGALAQTLTKLREMIAAVRQSAERVSGVSGMLSQESGKVIDRVRHQTDKVMEISAALEQMTVAVTEVSHGANGVDQAASQTQAIAREGNSAMERNLANTDRTVQTVGASSHTIAELSDEIQKITEITNVIKEIADQTNLLALNAAIEAARAGEQGRGFAVVADEVRKLAERTTASTADITAKVESITGKTRSAVDAMDRVRQEVAQGAEFSRSISEVLRKISTAAVEVAELSHHIASATREQSTASEQTAKNMESISILTEENSSSIQEVGRDAKAMTETANDLMRAVEQFRV